MKKWNLVIDVAECTGCNLCTLAMAGGGLRMGQVIGQSDRTASVPQTDPVTPANLMATLMHTLFNLGELRLDSGLPADVSRAVQAGQIIPQLV